MKLRLRWIVCACAVVGLGLLAWLQLQHVRVMKAIFLGRCQKENVAFVKASEVSTLDVLLACDLGDLNRLRGASGSLVISASGKTIASMEFSGGNSPVASWLTSEDLESVILTWSTKRNSLRLATLLEPGKTYQIGLEFLEPPPPGSSWWLVYSVNVHGLDNPPKVR